MISFIAIAVLTANQTPVKCPVMGSAIDPKIASVEYAGAKYSFCCAGCDVNFAKTPSDFLGTQREAGNTAGVFLFDPVSRKRLDIAKAKYTADHQGLRYPFASEANRNAFRRTPGKFAAVPAKEALFCPVGNEAVPSYAKASDYADHAGVRYYMCCDGCAVPFLKSPAKYLVNAKPHVKSLAVHASKSASASHDPSVDVISKAKFGKYEADLRIPEDGLFAQEEIDVEFRLVDTTQKDPVEEGFKGVGGVQATAVMTMPSMQGMPEARPNIHREGVPGDYGLELFFPHGGDYKIDVTAKFPSGETHKFSFVVDVRDERPTAGTRVMPYRLEVIDWPHHVDAGKPAALKMKVFNTKTGDVQTSFDIAHEMYFHLLIASKDLNWFLHEHPTMAPDGTWSIPITFPAGGDYWIYGDVAPSGKGSQVLITKVTVQGAKPTWDTRLIPTTTATDGGLKGLLSTLEPIEIGRKSTIQVKLFDVKTGQAVGDTVKWLGAAGHMMIFHEDGQTVVHSHPAEDAENEALVKKGIVRFTGRFPKPGLYKVYAQFDWQGAIRTLGFAIEVKS